MVDKTDIRNIDKNMDFDHHITRDGFDWYTVDDAPLALDGLYWYKPGDQFRRIPMDVKVSEKVNHLAWHTAGVMTRFRSDAKEIRLEVKISHSAIMFHMTSVGRQGFDLYTGSGTAKIYNKSTSFHPMKDEYIASVFGPVEDSRMREFTINFPLYSHPEKLLIGVNSGAKILPPTPWKDPRPVVVYGTSITQGGCATRPGMCHTNIMSRMLDRPFINLGFSGGGKGEPEIAETIASIKDPAAFVLEYDGNAKPQGLLNTLSNFIDTLRAKHPETPIVLVSRLLFASEFGNDEDQLEQRRLFTKIHLDELTARRKNGDTNIHFIDGTTLYGEIAHECTVDGCHATDLGFYQVASRMAPELERIIANI